MLDLEYDEDVRAEVDVNVVMSSEGRFVEVQGTGEHGTFARAELDALLDLATGGITRARRARSSARSGVARPVPRRETRGGCATRCERSCSRRGASGKRDELRAIFAAAGIAVASLDDSGSRRMRPRTSSRCTRRSRRTRARRRAGSPRGCPGRAVIADDSGLEVDALDGAPGVRSKRWCGERRLAPARRSMRANNAALLRALRGDARDAARRARYVCVGGVRATASAPVGRARRVRGADPRAPRGDGGFGYDPLLLERRICGARSVSASREEKARGESSRARDARVARAVGARARAESLDEVCSPVDRGAVPTTLRSVRGA